MDDFKKVLDLMFDPEDTVCVSDSKFATHSVPISSILSGEVTMVSPSQKMETRIVKTADLTLLAVNSILGFRNDKNVQKHRSFLWEIDVGSRDSQIEYVKKIGIPTSCAIFSGNKSVHFATVLEQSVDAKTYTLLAKWAFAIGTLFDKNCKNPSRSIRIPGAIRPETGYKQELLELGSRVKLDDFMAWLNKYEHLRPIEREYKKSLTNEKSYETIPVGTRNQLKNGIRIGKGRNQAWYGIFCDFAKAGYEKKEATDILFNYFKEESDFKLQEWLVIAQSAFKNYGKYGN
jgi:hypothetical protein